MRRLSFSGKFALVAVVFVTPLLVTSALLLGKLRGELLFIHKEQRGAGYAAALSDALSALQRHRALQSALLNGDASARPAADAARAEIDRFLGAVDELDRGNADFGASKDWQEIRERWEDLKKDLPDDSERASISAHTALAAKIGALMSTVGDKSNLTLDPTIDSFYLQDTLLQRLPAFSEALGEAAAVAQGVAARKKLESDERTRLLMLATSAFTAMEATTKDLDTAFESNEELKASLGPAYDGIGSLGPYFGMLRQKVLGDAVAISPAELYGMTESALGRLQGLAAQLPGQLNGQLRARASRLERQALASLAVSAGCLLLAVYLLWGLSASVRRSLEHAGAVAAAIAAGRLDNAIDTDGRDEVARVLRSLDAMQADLRERAMGIRDSSDQIGSVAHDMAAGSEDLAQRTQSQAASLQSAARTLSDFTQAVNQTAADAVKARELTTATSDLAITGGSTVREVVTSMERISHSSSRISEITTLIDSIAFQTNILALNAAVEAARAGRHGLGFAVVAGEVRNLAQRTSAAAKEIAGLVSGSAREVEAGSRLVADAGRQADQIVTSVREVAETISRIASASASQTRSIAEVNSMMQNLDAEAVTQQNEALISRAAAAAERLQREAASLAEAVSVFRLGPGQDDLALAAAPFGQSAAASPAEPLVDWRQDDAEDAPTVEGTDERSHLHRRIGMDV